MSANLTQQDNLLLQSYYTFSLLVELNNNNFLESNYFSEMSFGNPEIKRALKDEIKIDNRGCAMIALYSMLVIPHEMVKKSYPSEYETIRQFLETHTINTHLTSQEQDPINFIGHIRNSVSHASVEFRENDVVIFSDYNSKINQTFSTELPLSKLGEFMDQLQQVHVSYVKNLQSPKL